MAMTIEDKLGKNKFVVDNNYRHIEINKDCTDEELKRRVVMACPAKLYQKTEDSPLITRDVSNAVPAVSWPEAELSSPGITRWAVWAYGSAKDE